MEGFQLCYDCLQSDDTDRLEEIKQKRLGGQGKHKKCLRCRKNEAIDESMYCSTCTPTCHSCGDKLGLKDANSGGIFCNFCNSDIENGICTGCGLNQLGTRDNRGRCTACQIEDELYKNHIQHNLAKKYAMTDGAKCACGIYDTRKDGNVCQSCPDRRKCSHCRTGYYIPGLSSLEMCKDCYAGYVNSTAAHNPRGGWAND